MRLSFLLPVYTRQGAGASIGRSVPHIGCFREVRELLQELVTPSGYRFWGESLVTIDGVDYPLDELTREQRSFVLAVRDVNALNAAYAGRAEFRAEGLPAFEEVFPEIAAERRRKRGAR